MLLTGHGKVYRYGFFNWLICFGMLMVLSAFSASALTRWSAVHFVPDADLLEGGTFVADVQTYCFSNTEDDNIIKPAGILNFGVSEWINVEAGYTGAFTMGLKARLLGETRSWMPSLALGVHNLFSHYEAWVFDRPPDTLGAEPYLVFAKSIEAARLRFHLGIQSIPDNSHEQFNPFCVIEKYFGAGLYVSAEVHRRDREVHPSLFIAWRILKRRLEISLGIVDIAGMFTEEGSSSSRSFYQSGDDRFVRPGIKIGLRFRGTLRVGKNDGLTGLESSLRSHTASIDELRSDVDSIKALLDGNASRIATIDKSISRITDSALTDEQRYRALATDRLAVLKTLYDAEPFEPDAVNKAMAELVANRDLMLPALYTLINDPTGDLRIRTLGITALGEIGTRAASDLLIQILGQSTNADMTIEALIALGKMKETRAVYLMQQLSNDPNDDVAFTATEVLQKLEKETGISVTPVRVVPPSPRSVPEKKIGSNETYQPDDQRGTRMKKTLPDKDTVAAPGGDDMGKIEEPRFTEATLAEKAKVENGSVTDDDSASSVKNAGRTAKTTVPEAVITPAKRKSGTDTLTSKAGKTAKATDKTLMSADSVAAAKTPDSKPVIPASASGPVPEQVQKKDGAEKKQPRRQIDTSKDEW